MSQQLVKKGTNGGMVNVNPKSWIEAIKDKNTGQTLVEILQGFNMYFLPYNGNTLSTRCLVPTMLRKKGLWITYVKYDGNVYTEWYAADEIDDKSWGDSSNWRIGNNTLVGDITISANGNWVINGTETKFKAVGEKGNTPLLRVANNRLQVSYDLGASYIDVTTNPIYTKFRWYGTTGDTQANNVGRIQASTDEGKTWTNMSNDFTNNLHISRYIGVNESLPTSGIAEGTIYAKGPYYAEDDTLNDNPIYRLWVYAWKGNTLAWQDNGEFQSIAAGVVQETGDSETEVMSQKAVTEKLSELGLNTGINQDSDYTSSVSIEGKYIHRVYGVLESSGKRMSVPIAVNKNDIIRVYTSSAEAAEVVIGQCDENGNNIKPLVLGGKSGLSYYYAIVDFDGYIIVSCHITYCGLIIAKGGLGDIANQLREEAKSNILKAKEEVQKSASEDAAQKISALRVENISNTVWKTNLNYLGDITSERLRYYQSVRNAKIVGYDIPISINLIWNGYATTDVFRVRLLGKKDGAWSVIADTGNKPSSEVNPNHNGVLDIKIGGSSNFVQLTIDTSFIPIGDGNQFTKEGEEPEFVFSDNCYYESVSNEPSVVVENGTPAIPKLYPKHKLPCISFQFDDIVDEDDQIVSLFDEYNAKCNFAFMASESKIATYASKYLAWQKRGYGICNHSIDGNAFNTTNYPNVPDALSALMTAKNRLEAEGFVVNGFVSPSSTYYSDVSNEETRLSYLEAVEKTNAYAFTWSDSKNHSRESNPCRMTRYSIEVNKIDAIKSWIDGYMNADKIVTLYGHSYNLGKLNTTSNEIFSIDKVREILEYIIAKRDAGELFFGNTDECVKYFFDL